MLPRPAKSVPGSLVTNGNELIVSYFLQLMVVISC